MRRSDRYENSIISERKPFVWPGNKTLAVWIAPNVEVWNYDSPAGQAVSPNVGKIVPDVVNYAWREYGMRVGLWRIADVLDAAGVKATIALNSLVCEHYPKAMEEMKKRGWEFMGHGTTNSESLAGLEPGEGDRRPSGRYSRRSSNPPDESRAGGSAPGSQRPTTRSTFSPKRA